MAELPPPALRTDARFCFTSYRYAVRSIHGPGQATRNHRRLTGGWVEDGVRRGVGDPFGRLAGGQTCGPACATAAARSMYTVVAAIRACVRRRLSCWGVYPNFILDWLVWGFCCVSGECALAGEYMASIAAEC
jgi:hypothetical protein